MPSSPFLLYSGIGIIGAVFALALSSSILTCAASLLLLRLYRRQVAKLMSASADDTDRADVHPSESGYSPGLRESGAIVTDAVAPPAGDDLANRLYGLVHSEPRRHALRYVLAEIPFALITGSAGFFAFSQTQINYLRAAHHPLQFLFILLTCLWPLVVTANVVVGGKRATLFYFAVLSACGAWVAFTPTESPFTLGGVAVPVWSGESPLRLAGKWSLFNAAPTLLIIVFRNRRMRAVAPMVLSFMTVVSAGVLSIITAAFLYQDASVRTIAFAAEALRLSARTALVGYLLLLLVLGCLLCGAIGWRLLVGIRNRYQRKSLSDQSLAIDAIGLIFVSFYAAILAFAGPGWALSPLIAFAVCKIAAGFVNKSFRRGTPSLCYEPALLVLRVFSLGKRSESLFDRVANHWRYIGNVRLIAGTDLAISTIAPHQFLNFVSGKLKRLFIRDRADVESSVAQMDTRRDPDGRFRLNDFFCHADTWQMVLLRLLKSTNVVLMDLRNFTRNNAGCVFEIQEMINTVPLDHLVFVVDRTTDRKFLQQTLEEAYRELRSSSPNASRPLSALHLFELKSRGDYQNLLKQLCAAAAVDVSSFQPDAGRART